MLIQRVEETFKESTFLVDDHTSRNIDSKGENDTDPEFISNSFWSLGRRDLPDPDIEKDNAHKIPLHINPTPDDGGTVHLSPIVSLDEEKYQGRDERDTIAEDEVFWVQVPELYDGISAEEGKVHIESHAESPESINAQKPDQISIGRSSAMFSVSVRTFVPGRPGTGKDDCLIRLLGQHGI